MSAPALPRPLTEFPLISDWLEFSRDGTVLVLSGRVELGQGNMTAIAQMAADELDLPVSMVRITGADTTRTPDEGFTAGSLSIAAGGMSVRLAASAARARLLARAAELTQSQVAELSLDEGRVLRGGEETGLDLWGLSGEVDLDLPVADHAAPKRPDQRVYSGVSIDRIDLRERATGQPFVHDIQLDGMLHGRPVHPPAIGMSLVNLDTD